MHRQWSKLEEKGFFWMLLWECSWPLLAVSLVALWLYKLLSRILLYPVKKIW